MDMNMSNKGPFKGFQAKIFPRSTRMHTFQDPFKFPPNLLQSDMFHKLVKFRPKIILPHTMEAI